MTEQQDSLEAIKDIRRMMERSSRFVSLSGLSGVAAGCCALAGAWYATTSFSCNEVGGCNLRMMMRSDNSLLTKLLIIAGVTFISALLSSFFFTWLRSRKHKTTLWGASSLRLFWNLAIPLVAAAVFLLRMIQLEQYELIAPGCLIFYGLALVNAGKYTLGEVRYLGYGQIVLGVINLWCIGYGLYFWTAGFGFLHILYGALMWWKYERNDLNQ